MTPKRTASAALALVLVLALAACSGGRGSSSGLGGFFSGGSGASATTPSAAPGPHKSRLRDLFLKGDDPNTTVKVNKYIWNAALDVLNFLPIESVDPFTGVIVTGYGTPPGGGRAYRATIYIQDPALDARSLKLSLQTRGGGSVSPETLRAVEDAILSRARELRIADSKL